MDRVLKNSTLKAEILTKSAIFEEPDYTTTAVPVINIALSGKFDGGLLDGITTLAGPSKHFKSTLALIMAKAYLDKFPEAIIFYYDNERGMTSDYFKSVGIDPDRVVRMKIHNIEELKSDMMRQLTENLKKGDKAFFMVDSVGNLASVKEIEDAKDEKIVVDMTRAKAFKSLYRIITPYITDLQLPYVQIAHVYAELGLFPKIIVSGGTGIMLASDTILVIGRAQEKEGKELKGYTFKLKIEKSRFAVEGSILDLEVSFEGGVKRWGGLLSIALECGEVIKPKNGWYTRPCVTDDKSWRKKDTYTGDFWIPILDQGNLQEYIENKYTLKVENLVDESLIDDSEDMEEFE